MSDDLDRQLGELPATRLPRAPEALRARLLAVVAAPPAGRGSVAGRSPWQRLSLVAATMAVIAVGAAIVFLANGAPRSLPVVTPPASVGDLPVMTVSEAIAAHAAGELPEGRAAIRGFWSNQSIAHSCAPAAQGDSPGDLEIYCHDGEYGIAERDEFVMLVSSDGQVTHEAEGPYLTPYVNDGGDRFNELAGLPRINGQPYPPVPIVVVGHFDDPRAAQCRPQARQLCRDRLVLDEIVQFDPSVVPTPGVTPTPTPFPDPQPSAMFERAMCEGDVAYSFVGWTTTRELEMPFNRDGHVFAMVTEEAVLLTNGGWQDDPNGSGHRFQIWGRRICIAQEGHEGEMEFASVPGSAFVLWDDGLRVPGENPLRP